MKLFRRRKPTFKSTVVLESGPPMPDWMEEVEFVAHDRFQFSNAREVRFVPAASGAWVTGAKVRVADGWIHIDATTRYVEAGDPPAVRAGSLRVFMYPTQRSGR